MMIGESRRLLELVGGHEDRTTRARCHVCQELVVETTVYHPSSGWNGVCGPGSSMSGPAWKEKRYHCPGCGVMYQFVKEDE